ncbi:hypothetical protein PACTADRAFT_49966 [Pachysolen tannophilus NRRL Y-2460]|uniref:Signal peptidase subunit 3 n=1 Tax=Pachysolen tannophilus NRRL Y-2460 TaxID=669874 RepID=A0A1E4TU01_PACTA|nr:hypothetical protein PACTADRAFT_49966 [Pachysolen tannophilus NRRL Y-2460]
MLIAVSSYLQLNLNDYQSVPSTVSNIDTITTLKYSRNFGSKNREAKENIRISSFDLSADLTPLFNWNTKQIFVYLLMEYEGYNGLSSSKITFWDNIIHDKSEAILDLNSVKGKYSCWDVNNNFSSNHGVMKLGWNIQPHVGLLLWGETKGSTEINLL